MSFKIVTDIDYLKIPCEHVDLEEGMEIGKELLAVLETTPDGIGLAANQIGIQKKVVVIDTGRIQKERSRDPIVLINPVITERDGFTNYVESCLSFPGQFIETNRNFWVTVESDNMGTVVFGPYDNEPHQNDICLLESVVVQHEIDHIEGITMFDRHKTKGKSYGRNDIVEITNGTETKKLKYKKAEIFLNAGWTLI